MNLKTKLERIFDCLNQSTNEKEAIGFNFRTDVFMTLWKFLDELYQLKCPACEADDCGVSEDRVEEKLKELYEALKPHFEEDSYMLKAQTWIPIEYPPQEDTDVLLNIRGQSNVIRASYSMMNQKFHLEDKIDTYPANITHYMMYQKPRY